MQFNEVAKSKYPEINLKLIRRWGDAARRGVPEMKHNERLLCGRLSKSKMEDEIQVLAPKSALKSTTTKAPLQKQVSFNIEEEEEQEAGGERVEKTKVPELPKRIITRPPSIHTNSNQNSNGKRWQFADIDSNASSTSTPSIAPKSPKSSKKEAVRKDQKSSWWSISSIFESLKIKDVDYRPKPAQVVQSSSSRMNPFTWVSSKLVSFVKAASASHTGSTNSKTTTPQKRPVPPPPLPERVIHKPKRDSGISIGEGDLDVSTKPRPKVHVCRYCGGTTMINPYRLCPQCNGTGVSDTNILTDLYQSSQRVVTSIFEWISPSKPVLPVESIPMTTITSYPRTSFDSNSSGTRNPRSSLDPGPQSIWSQELDYRRVTKQYVRQTNLRRSGSDKRLNPAEARNVPLKHILETVVEPSDVGFTDIVNRHC